MEATTVRQGKMGIREYFDTLITILRSPARFFEGVADEEGHRRALFFLMVSGIFYCSVSMTYFFENSLAMGVVMMANAVLMPALAALFTWMLMTMSGNRVMFIPVFNVYAYASGAVMVVSWIPGLAMVMEPIRAVLVGVGLVKVFGLGKARSAVLVLLTALLLLLFFWSVAPLVMELRHAATETAFLIHTPQPA